MTELDIKVLDAVREQLAALGYPPTIAALALRLEEYPSSVQRSLTRLEAKSLLKREKGKRRGTTLGDQPDLRAVPTQALEVELGRRGVTFRALSRIEPQRHSHGAPCAATVCNQLVQRGKLFCYRHWCVIPLDVRQQILQAFGAGDQIAYEMAITAARDHIDGCGDGLRRFG